jgi:hypothetical protein
VEDLFYTCIHTCTRVYARQRAEYSRYLVPELAKARDEIDDIAVERHDQLLMVRVKL